MLIHLYYYLLLQFVLDLKFLITFTEFSVTLNLTSESDHTDGYSFQ